MTCQGQCFDLLMLTFCFIILFTFCFIIIFNIENTNKNKDINFLLGLGDMSTCKWVNYPTRQMELGDLTEIMLVSTKTIIGYQIDQT